MNPPDPVLVTTQESHKNVGVTRYTRVYVGKPNLVILSKSTSPVGHVSMDIYIDFEAFEHKQKLDGNTVSFADLCGMTTTK